MTSQEGEVNVVGSANIDLVVRVERFPLPGETLAGKDFVSVPGGKGANQAAAVAKLGGQCRLLAKLGRDDFGTRVLAGLLASGVEVGSVLIEDETPTGVAMITVDAAGENMIVVAPGSNHRLSASEVRTQMDANKARVLLVQLEIPIEAVGAACGCHTGQFILNPAPARDIPAEILERVDVLTPNETECEHLCGVRPNDAPSIREASNRLLAQGVKAVVLTLGDQGCVLAHAGGIWRYPALEVEAIDTTGAGDAFNGALALFLARGRSIAEAVWLAVAAGSLAVTKFGAQASMPTLNELLAVEQNLPERTAL
jgi:ribokinase